MPPTIYRSSFTRTARPRTAGARCMGGHLSSVAPQPSAPKSKRAAFTRGISRYASGSFGANRQL